MPPRPLALAAERATAFYARVTTDESVRRDLSLPNQLKRFEELAAQHGWEAEAFVEQTALSGELGPEDRPRLAALLAAVEAQRIGRVVVRHLDRLGRGVVLEQIVRTLRRHGVELRTFDGVQDVRSAAGRLGVRAQAMVGAFETERTGERVREMKRQKAREGVYVGPTPYGFATQARAIRELTARHGEASRARAVEEAERLYPHRGRLVVDPAEAETVRTIFRLYVDERLGSRRIAHALTAAGLRTRDGFAWSPQSVIKIVRDPKVAGLVSFDEDAYRRGVESALPVWEQELYPGTHEAIVPREAWERAQELRREAGGALLARPSLGRIYPLRGVVRCAHGHPAKVRTAGTTRGQAYYACRARCIRGVDPALGGCDAPLVPVDVAEAAVREVLGALLGDPRHVHACLQAAQRAAAAERASAGRQGREADAEIRRAEAARARCHRLLDEADPGSEEEQAALDRLVALKRELAALRAGQAERGAEVVPLPAPVAREQVEASLARLRERLAGDAEAFQGLVAALAAEHGLVVDLLEDRRVRVGLALDPAALGSRPRLVATASPRVPVSMEGGHERLDCNEWAARANRAPPACACGCGEAIRVRPGHRWKGIPRFVPGHHRQDMAAFVRALRDEGLLTVSEAAAELGIAATTLRRLEDRGLASPERRAWGGRAPMRLYRRSDLAALREALGTGRSGAG